MVNFTGSDGFFELDTARSSLATDKYCELQADNHPEYFGTSPSRTGEQLGVVPACLIVPGNGVPLSLRAQALLKMPLE